MRPEELRAIRDAEPFVPFRIFLTDGKSYDVPHRDFLMIARNLVDIGVPGDPGSGVYDRIVHISPLHVVRVEHLQAA